MTRGRLGYPGAAERILHGPLEDGFEEPRAERAFRRHCVYHTPTRAQGDHPGGLLLFRPEHR